MSPQTGFTSEVNQGCNFSKGDLQGKEICLSINHSAPSWPEPTYRPQVGRALWTAECSVSTPCNSVRRDETRWPLKSSVVRPSPGLILSECINTRVFVWVRLCLKSARERQVSIYTSAGGAELNSRTSPVQRPSPRFIQSQATPRSLLTDVSRIFPLTRRLQCSFPHWLQFRLHVTCKKNLRGKR